MNRIFLLLGIIVLAASHAMPQKTTRGRLKLRDDVKIGRIVNAIDTVIPGIGDIVVSGFEKAQHSASESFFVTNHTSRTLTSITFTITYLNLRGEVLHARTETVGCDIPPEMTRKVDIRSWDRQKLWYYKDSQARHNDYCNPFDIRVRIDYVISPVSDLTE